MGILNHWTTVHLLFAQQTNLPFSEFQFIKVVLKLSKRQKSQRNHIRYTPQLSKGIKAQRICAFSWHRQVPPFSEHAPLNRDKIPDKALHCFEDPHPVHELRNVSLGTVHSKIWAWENAGLVTRAETFFLFRKSSELTQMTLKGRAGYTDLHFIGNPVT